MGKYQGYEKYKDSGVEWLGEIPEHWKICKLKRTVNIFGRIGFRGYTTQDIVLEGEGAITLSPSNILDGKINYTNRTYLSWYKYHESPEIQVFNKDILFVKTGSTTGKVAIVENMPEPMTINPQLVVLKEINCCPEFLAYLMNADFYQFQVMGFRFGGSTPAMTQESLGQTEVILLPLDEQKTIARFLDYKTKQINDLIAKKETLIEKLDEKRTALISHAVTKGLDPSVPMKDSGVEWMGNIPKHWQTAMVKRVAKADYKCFTDGDWIESPYITESGVRLIQTGNIGIGHYREQGFRYISEETFKELRCTEISQNDVLVCRLDGPVGRACLVPNLGLKMITSVDNSILKVSKNFDSRFVVYLMSSNLWLEWIQSLCRVGGGFRFRISRTILGEQRITAPPIEEQEKIADLLDKYTEETKGIKLKIQEAIDRLKEYRTALITNAVTGKIDVRQVPIP